MVFLTRETEKRNTASVGIDAKSVSEILRIFNDMDKKIATVIGAELPGIEKAVQLIMETIKKGGNVYIVGAGTSGRLGVIEASEIPPTFGLAPARFRGLIAGGDTALRYSIEAAEDDLWRGGDDLTTAGFKGGDLVIGVTASGSTPYVLGAVEKAHSLGAKTIGVSCNHDAVLSGLVDASVEVVVGPEIVAGSTRMRAGTSQKMVLNMMTTTALIKLGYVYDGYMVGVQASNQKLKNRSIGMVTEITSASEAVARNALEASDWDVRVATVHLMTGLSINESKKRLETETVREILR